MKFSTSVGVFILNLSILLGSISSLHCSHDLSQGLRQKTKLGMGLFDPWSGKGSGKDRLEEEWKAQQELLKLRRDDSLRDKYFEEVEERRSTSTREFNKKWSWQSKKYNKGEDPINEWKKRRESGDISDLENQYGDPKKIGGIPLPSASFGVGGEFGVGGKFDNGGRFDLRLPYAEQGYVDEDADVMGKLTSFFSGKKKVEKASPKVEKTPEK